MISIDGIRLVNKYKQSQVSTVIDFMTIRFPAELHIYVSAFDRYLAQGGTIFKYFELVTIRLSIQ